MRLERTQLFFYLPKKGGNEPVKPLTDKKISLRLDSELADKLENYAVNERVPVSFVLRHLVLRFFASPAPEFRGSALGTSPTSRFSSEKADQRRSAAAVRADLEKTSFEKKVCALFDDFRGIGLDTKEAAKRTNFALKDQKHPWASYEVIADIIRKSGRFRKQKGVK